MNNNRQDALPVTSYAMEYGTILGISWTVVFAMYAMALRTSNSLLFLIGFCGLIGIGILPFLLAFRLKEWQEKGERLGWMRSLHFSLSMFMYACMLSSALEYFYFEFMDKGEVVRCLSNMLLNNDAKEAYRQLNMLDAYMAMQDMIREVALWSNVDKALAMFNNSFTWSLFMTLPVTLVANLKKTR